MICDCQDYQEWRADRADNDRLTQENKDLAYDRYTLKDELLHCQAVNVDFAKIISNRDIEVATLERELEVVRGDLRLVQADRQQLHEQVVNKKWLNNEYQQNIIAQQEQQIAVLKQDIVERDKKVINANLRARFIQNRFNNVFGAMEGSCVSLIDKGMEIQAAYDQLKQKLIDAEMRLATMAAERDKLLRGEVSEIMFPEH